MAFRTQGVNHAGIAWRLAPSLITLADQITDAWPGRATGADGTVASAAHDAANPTSDHSPDTDTVPALVRAIDITEDLAADASMDDLGEALRAARDPRLLYWIHHGRMFASYDRPGRPAWIWRLYTGFNQHETHGHLSVVATGAELDPAPWMIGETPTMQLSTHQLVTQLTVADLDAICGARTIGGRWVIAPTNADRAGVAAYYRARLGNPADPEWPDFHVALLAAGAINDAAPPAAGGGAGGPLTINLTGSARPV